MQEDMTDTENTPTEELPREGFEQDDDKKKDKNKGHSSEYTHDNCPFQVGEMLTFVNIRFPGNAKAQPFLVAGKKLSYRQRVMAMSDRGITVGYVNSLAFEVPFNKEMLPIRKIIRIATDEDIEKQKSAAAEEKRAENICLGHIQKYQLQMTLTHVEIMQFGKKAVFYFTAPERVDFRELVKSLVSDLKMRIELRQITVRDRSAAIGAIGICGRQNCCSSFLQNYGNVSIKMAKNQSLALLPNKINGVCGQLKCCIRYEDDVYSEKRRRLPEEGSFIKTQNGDCGKVLRVHVLDEEFDMLTDKGQKRRYGRPQYSNKNQLADNWRFPDSFDHIVDETSDVIGKVEKRAWANFAEPERPRVERVIRDSDYIPELEDDESAEEEMPNPNAGSEKVEAKEQKDQSTSTDASSGAKDERKKSRDRRRRFQRRPPKKA